jgi:anthranilate phosphoribosyltransferase
MGFNTILPEAIFGGETIKDAAEIFVQVLKNEGSNDQRDVVIANAGHAIQCFEPDKTYQECKDIATEALVSNQAFNIFKKVTSN